MTASRYPRYALSLLLLLAAVLLTPASRAQVGGGTGPMPRHFPHAPPTPPPSATGPAHMRVTLDDGSRGPLVLSPKNGGFIGEFVVWNDGPGSLTVSRVAMRGDEDDPRLPQRFNARFTDGGGGSSVVQPHSSKRVRVTWVPDRAQKVHEALGHVVLTSNDESAGEVAMAFVAPREGPLAFFTTHLLSWLLALPLVGALVALVMGIIGYKEPERLRGIMLATTAFQCLLAILLYEGFSGIATRADGNDGFQFIERVTLVRGLGVEYFVGVDGLNVSLVLLTALVGFACAIASYGVTERFERYYGCFALLLAGTMGVFVALDLSLLVASWVVMLGALTALAASGAVGKGPASWPRSARKLAVYAAISALLLAVGVAALYLHSDPTYLADGTRVEHTYALPELMRVAYNAKHLTLFGCSWVKVVWGVLFVAFAIVTALVPLHGWFIDVLADLPTPVRAVLVGLVMKGGIYGLLRVSFGVLPDGSRWAATTLVAAGVLTIAFATVSALRKHDVLEIVAYATVGQLGFALVGLGALTREGIAGCLALMVSHGAVAALLVLLVGAQRASKPFGVTELSATASPIQATAIALGLLALAGLPGLSGFWGEVLSLVGAFPVQRALVLVAAVCGAVTLGFHVRLVRRVFGSLSTKETLADFASGDLAAVTPLIVLSLVLGVHPAPFFTLVQGGVSDLNLLVNPPGPDEIARGDADAAGVSDDPASYSSYPDLSCVPPRCSRALRVGPRCPPT